MIDAFDLKNANAPSTSTTTAGYGDAAFNGMTTIRHASTGPAA